MSINRYLLGFSMLAGLACTPGKAADPAPFELTGPSLRVTVTRGEQTLPIAQVPSLSEGDKISIAADLPQDQGARFILVSAFLRGATNPPPKDWISFAETWKKKDKDKALALTIPKGARQMVLFLAPDTGGAEGSLVEAVRGKPGEFVRATQDLNQASLDRSRLDSFMSAIRAQENTHPEYLRSVAPALSRSLAIKLNEECLSRVIEMQAACLLDNRDSLVLADVHSSSMAETLTGAPTDLALQLAATREAGYGYYSPYIAVVRDVARIFGAFSSPEFDYLPTLSVRRDDTAGLLLNAAPSFQKPKSVMVVAMPAIEADSPPRLRSGAQGPICAAQTGAVLPVEGAPLIYSTTYARDMRVAVKSATGQSMELPVVARADRGGYMLTGGQALPPAFQGTAQAHLHGFWGFDRFDGPDFTVQMPDDKGWTVAGEPPALVIGRDNRLLLEGSAPACVESVQLRQGDGPAKPLSWSVEDAGRLAVTLPLTGARAGPISMDVKYRGQPTASTIALRSYAEASRLDVLTLHAGDTAAMLTGQRLDQVESVEIAGLSLAPDGLDRDGKLDRLRLVGSKDAAQGSGLEAGRQDRARVRLRDGRALSVSTTIAAARPRLRLIGKTVTPGPQPDKGLALTLDGKDMLPDKGQLVFSAEIAGGELGADSAIEVAGDRGPPTRLTVADGLRLEDRRTLVATLDPAKLEPGLFGPLRVRFVGDKGASDWQPLTTLTRLPQIEAVRCVQGGKGCTITGRDLFLIDAVASSASFDSAAQVAHGYTGSALETPEPTEGFLYLRLRDAPDTVVSIPAPPSEPESTS